ncbi:Low-affinity methionine permease [Nakaseomyces bracarensis]|uniref:Low-affinity methionine permease n=1 Tax=Nakaseomyces bracarensis TaxID=273131 RepID=A0ABR4NTD9_9SACH
MSITKDSDEECINLFDNSDLEVGSYQSIPRDPAEKLDNEVPQGRHLGVFSTTVLFVSRIVGSGIFSTPSSIFVNCGGNTFIFFAVWLSTGLFAYAGLYIFLEFGYHLPRSGGRKVFLETAYRRPKLMMSVTIACFSITSGMCLAGSIVFGKYFLKMFNFDKDTYNSGNASKYVSIGIVLTAAAIHGISVRVGIKIQNAFGIMKMALIMLMCLTGTYAIFFYKPIAPTQWDRPTFSFHENSTFSINSLASAFITAFFCFSGWDSVHSVTSEVKNPSRTLPLSGIFSLTICAFCYTLMNVAYIKVLSYEEISEAGPLIGSVLFEKLFGPTLGGTLLTGSVAISAASNVLVVIYGISRVNQEIFREGYLPFSKTLARNWPKDAPLFSLLICAILTCIWIVILPSEGESYNYLVSVEGYGNQFFLLLVAVGLLIFRRQKEYVKNETAVRASTTGVVLIIILLFYLAVSPFIGNQEKNRVANLPPYEMMSLIIISLGTIFWIIKFKMLPFLFKYKLTPVTSILSDGLKITEWVHTK